MILTPALSSYLDFIRFLAAFSVLCGHMDQDGLYMSWFPLSRFSHEAVIIFFVLSGFIIFNTSNTRKKDWRYYLIARSSRIYSVAIPAIVFCSLLTLFLGNLSGFDVTQLSNYSDLSVSSTLSTIFFLNQSWGNISTLSLNRPYWSLCYEVWYYIVFGIWFFSDFKWRWVLAGLAGLFAGPAIMALFPVWIIGALLSANGGRFKFSCRNNMILFYFSILVIISIDYSGVDITIRKFFYDNVPGFWRLKSSQRIFTDLILGLAVAINIFSFQYLGEKVQGFFQGYSYIFKWLGGFSFTLYLFHRPITQIGGYLFPNRIESIWKSIIMLVGIILISFLISLVTERRLHIWRKAISFLLSEECKSISNSTHS